MVTRAAAKRAATQTLATKSGLSSPPSNSIATPRFRSKINGTTTKKEEECIERKLSVKTEIKDESPLTSPEAKTPSIDVKKRPRDEQEDLPHGLGDILKNTRPSKRARIVKPIEDIPKKKRTVKYPYGLTPGSSPFPDHPKPTKSDCEEVHRLLSEKHGWVKRPTEIPPPSLEVAGCGEVPDLLDALIRTLLSASTQASNANLALAGLKDRFGLLQSGRGKGSVNWEAVRQATQPEVADAIKRGGLANAKSKNIKAILDNVYTQNTARLDELLMVSKDTKSFDAMDPTAKEQLLIQTTQFKENMLSMDYVFEMSTDDAMLEMVKLPGIGVKTASCVQLFCMKRPSFAVDTHVWRFCKWLGWVPDEKSTTRDKTFSHCEVRIPDDLKYPLHYLFLKHGKTCGRCRANTSAGTKEWNDTVCPIDHLVNRSGGRKTKVVVVKKVKGSGGGGKRKKFDETDESEESEEIDIEEVSAEESDEE